MGRGTFHFTPLLLFQDTCAKKKKKTEGIIIIFVPPHRKNLLLLSVIFLSKISSVLCVCVRKG